MDYSSEMMYLQQQNNVLEKENEILRLEKNLMKQKLDQYQISLTEIENEK